MTMTNAPQRLIIGISGGSGAELALRLLKALQPTPWETHLVVTEAGRQVLEHECRCSVEEAHTLADQVHAANNFFAPIASGSYATCAMVVLPCSMKTLAGIASGHSDNLLLRAADVCLKERRRLVLVARETPLSLIHLENMRRVTLAGGIILPPVLTMYTHPASLEELMDQLVGKILDALGIENACGTRWQ